MLVIIAILLGLILFALAPELVLWLLGAGLAVAVGAVVIGLVLLAWFGATWAEVAYVGAAGAVVLCALWFKRPYPDVWRACTRTMNRVVHWLTLSMCTLLAAGCLVEAVGVAWREGVATGVAGLLAAALALGGIAVYIFRDGRDTARGCETLHTEG